MPVRMAAIQKSTVLFLSSPFTLCYGFPGDSDSKEFACNAGDLGLIPGLEDPLEEGMATHSSILAWRIPRTEKPGGLQSMGSQSDTTEQLLSIVCDLKTKPLGSFFKLTNS